MDTIDDSEAFYVEPDTGHGSSPSPAKPTVSFVERLLSPQSLQKMMACGGGLLVLGMIAWLWSIGLFSNPIVVAAIIGTASLTTIASGIGLARFTRHELAGHGLALLGALALPLNLWFYDAQGLITIANGGHLWIPAAFCCMVYAAIAWILREAKFVYAFVGGIVLTGMLFLADRTIGQFWSLLPQVTFLVSAGWICAICERQFRIGDGDFSRQKFGRSFLRSGMIVMAAGLVLLAGAQVISMTGAFFVITDLPRIATDHGQKVWALGILLATTTGFGLEHATRKSGGQYGIAAIVTGLWSGLCLLDVLNVHPTVSHLAILVGVAVTFASVARIAWLKRNGSVDSELSQAVRRLADASVPLSIVLAIVACVHFLGQFFVGPGSVLFSAPGWTLVTQLALTTTALSTTAIALRRDSQQSKMRNEFIGILSFAGSIVVTLAVTTLFLQLELTGILPFAAAVLTAPLSAAIAACFVSDPANRRTMRLVAGTSLVSALVVIAVSCAVGETPTHVELMLIGATSAVVCFVSAASRGEAGNSVSGFIAVSCTLWQAGAAIGFDNSYALALAPTLAGVVLAIVRWLSRAAIHGEGVEVREDAQNTLVILGNVTGWLLAMNRVLAGEETIGLLAMLGAQLAGTVMTGLMARRIEWRMAFRVAAGGLMLAIILVANGLTSLTVWNRLELASLAAGSTLLALGIVAWFRETEREDGMATVGFSLGSLMTSVPLMIGLICHRIGGTGFVGWGMFHEVAVIVFGLSLLGIGLLGRIRSTTIGGSGLLAVFVLSLVTLIRLPDVLQSVSVMMMTGGATFFGTAILLSIYRDHLLALPGKIREGHGVFQVLKWR